MILNNFKLAGKVAIVTGCTRGLGLGMALGLAEAGASIVGVGRTGLAEARQRVEEAGRNSWGSRPICQIPG
jgi:2-dehydro-3-deoxy-D-gluconate 5-dehydrogenase